MVFVTGATGLLGSHLLYFLVKSGHRVAALRRKESDISQVRDIFMLYEGNDDLWRLVEWHEGDVLEMSLLAGVVQQVDCVYHCAAMVSFAGADKEILLRTNRIGTQQIADLCLKYQKRLCYVSSIAALGDAECEGQLIDERTPEIAGREHSVYSGSKGEAEKIVWEYIARGLNAVIVNPSIILGAGMRGRSSSRLFLTAAKGVPFYTGGINGYVDVRDVCVLMIRLAEDAAVKGERFVLNGGNYSYGTLFRTIALAVHKRPPFIYIPPFVAAFLWRVLAVAGKITGKKYAFTKETARSAYHRSYYSAMKVEARYPDFHFHTLEETVGYISAYL